MSDDFVTKEILGLELKVHAGEIKTAFQAALDEKFIALSDRLDTANIDRRDRVILEVTGEAWDNRGRVKDTIQRSIARDAADDDTRKKVKSALFGFSLPTGMAVLHWIKGGG